MPKIFKENKFALLAANIFLITIWVTLSKQIIDLIITDSSPFYIYKLGDLIRFIPPIWVTYYLWIVRKGFK